MLLPEPDSPLIRMSCIDIDYKNALEFGCTLLCAARFCHVVGVALDKLVAAADAT